jgi:hypothetical protein
MKHILELNPYYHVRNNFLTCNEKYDAPSSTRALDARRRRRARDEEEDDPEEGVLEIHNHIPSSQELEGGGYSDYDRRYARDDEEGREGEVLARYPASQYHFAVEGDEIVLYRGPGETSRHESDRHTFDARDHRSSRPPQTLRQLNAYMADFYKAKAGRR